MKGLREIDLNDSEQGEIKLLVPTPHVGVPWGVLSPLKGTLWGDQIRIVSGESLSHALHGWATPLARELGPHPRNLVQRIPDSVGLCAGYQDRTCMTRELWCKPGPRVLECYEAPGVIPSLVPLISRIVLSWREGRFVVVVDGPEFNLL